MIKQDKPIFHSFHEKVWLENFGKKTKNLSMAKRQSLSFRLNKRIQKEKEKEKES